jgi:alpha-L-fucosidase
MQVNSKAIYGCKEAPPGFTAPAGTLLTWNPASHRLYVHLMQYPGGTLRLSGYKGKVRYAQFLHDDSQLQIKPAEDNTDDLVLTLPERKPNVEIPVIELVPQAQ